MRFYHDPLGALVMKRPNNGQMVTESILFSEMTSEDEALINFLETLGVRVIFCKDHLWNSDGLRMFLPMPCKGPMSISQNEQKYLWHQGAFFLRFPTGDNLPAFPSHIYLVDDKNYDLGSIMGNQRKETRRALRKSTVTRIPIQYLYKDGFDLIKDTYSRQGRTWNQSTIESWDRYFHAAANNPLFEAWGAFVGTQLAAYRLDFSYRGGFYGEALFNRRDLLKYQVMNALMFVSTKEAIRRKEIDHVSYGMRGLIGESEALNRFKESMGYKRVPIAERIEVAPWLKPTFDFGLSSIINAVARRYTDRSAKAGRICGMINTYRRQRMNCLDE